MQKMLVTSPRITFDSTVLMEAARVSGQPTIRLQTFRPTEELRDVLIAVYGEPLFAIILASTLDHVVLEPTYDWLVGLPDAYRRRTVVKTILSEARQNTHPYFVKNADGMKAFEAKVYSSGAELPFAELYPDNYEVLVSEPVIWEVEYRCFIRERKLLTMSIYLRQGELAVTADGKWPDDSSETNAAHQFCETLLQDSHVSIPPACVIDVGRIKGRGWAVIEANPAYGSGIYGCDPYRVLEVVNRATLRSEDVSELDAPWVMRYEIED